MTLFIGGGGGGGFFDLEGGGGGGPFFPGVPESLMAQLAVREGRLP